MAARVNLFILNDECDYYELGTELGIDQQPVT